VIPIELTHAPAELSLRERTFGLPPGYSKARYHVRGIHHDIVKKATKDATIITNPSKWFLRTYFELRESRSDAIENIDLLGDA